MYASSRAYGDRRRGKSLDPVSKSYARQVCAAAALLALAVLQMLSPAMAAEPYDSLRAKWKTTLTGGTGFDTGNAIIAAKIQTITEVVSNTAATGYLDTLQEGGNRTNCGCLWTDLASTTVSSHLTSAYTRLGAMALAYQTTGSGLFKNAALRDKIVSAMDWMHANRYFVRTPYDNWWDWEIGVPLRLNNIMVLMYSDFTATQRANWIAVIDRFCPNQAGNDYKYLAANRMWRATVIAVRGLVGESSAKMVLARDSMSDLSDGHTGAHSIFKYVSNDDGFYTSGSFVQHGRYAYTGGYGKDLIKDVANAMYLLNGSSWAVTDPASANVYKWVYDSFEPVMYQSGLTMDMVRGREISRYGTTDANAGHVNMGAILRLSQMGNADATNFQRMLKNWIGHDAGFYADSWVDLNHVVLAQAIMGNASIAPRAEQVKNKIFPEMARAVHLRPGFGWGVSMFSNSIGNYEYHTGNQENKRGWFTGSGMTYLYNADYQQYADNFWATVNPARLPGTTVDTKARGVAEGAGFLSDSNWVGGASNGIYGVVGMRLKEAGTTLQGKKSWFLFDKEVVALGAGITSSDGRRIETIVDNRKITNGNSNALTVNGGTQSTSLTTGMQTYASARWAHLGGNVPGADIGYYFPTVPTVKWQREARTGKWTSQNGSNFPPGDPEFTRNYVTLLLDHGLSPNNGTYQYVTLPGFSASQVSAYASSPAIQVLENSTSAQAVKNNALNVIAVNFWDDVSKSIAVSSRYPAFITSNKKSSVVTVETPSDFEVSVADSTQDNTGTITVEIAKAATGLLSKDSAVTVNQMTPTMKITVNVNGSAGKTFKAKFKTN